MIVEQDIQQKQDLNNGANTDRIVVRIKNGDQFEVENVEQVVLYQYKRLKDLFEESTSQTLDLYENHIGNRILTKKIFTNLIKLASSIKNLTDDRLTKLKEQDSLNDFQNLSKELKNISDASIDDLMDVLVYAHYFDCQWIHIAIFQKIADLIQNGQIII